MRRLLKALLAAMIVALPAQPSFAQTAKQKSTLSSLADATLLDDRCDSMSINTLVVGILMDANGIEAADMGPDGKFKEFVFNRMAQTSKKLEALNESGICTLAAMTYGDKGLQVPGLLTED